MNATEISVAAIGNMPANNLQFVLSDVVDMASDAKGRVESAEQLAGMAQFEATNSNIASQAALVQVGQATSEIGSLAALAEYCRFHIEQISELAGVGYDLPPFQMMPRAEVAQPSEDG